MGWARRSRQPDELAKLQEIYRHRLLRVSDLLLDILQQRLQYSDHGHGQDVWSLQRSHDLGY